MRRKKKIQLRVFKLRSGEEIIAEVSGKTRSKIKLKRPLRIVSNFVTNPYTGNKSQSIFFTEWLGSTTEFIAEIPLNFVVVDMPPDPDLIELYEIQTAKNDVTNTMTNPSVLPLQDEEEMKQMNEDIDKKFDYLMKQFGLSHGETASFPVAPTGSTAGNFPYIPPIGNFSIRPNNAISFTMSIPHEIMASWIENGFIDYLKDCISDFVGNQFIDEIMEEEFKPIVPKKSKKSKKKKISKEEWIEPADDKKKKPEFGNNLIDWSPFVQDYLKDTEPPKNTEGS